VEFAISVNLRVLPQDHPPRLKSNSEPRGDREPEAYQERRAARRITNRDRSYEKARVMSIEVRTLEERLEELEAECRQPCRQVERAERRCRQLAVFLVGALLLALVSSRGAPACADTTVPVIIVFCTIYWALGGHEFGPGVDVPKQGSGQGASVSARLALEGAQRHSCVSTRERSLATAQAVPAPAAMEQRGRNGQQSTAENSAGKHPRKGEYQGQDDAHVAVRSIAPPRYEGNELQGRTAQSYPHRQPDPHPPRRPPRPPYLLPQRGDLLVVGARCYLRVDHSPD
jgi:hypothetical protein